MIYSQDILEWAKSYEGAPFHACLCDPPYHLTTGKKGGTGEASLNLNSPAGRSRVSTGFMSQKWDGGDVAFRPETWAAIGEHLLPGAFLIAFGGGRTYHRLACAVEDAGFILNSAIGWSFGSGFPKASRVRTGEEIETGESEVLTDIRSGSMHANRENKTFARPIKESHGMQKVWESHRYGLQALKPAMEFILVAQKPYRGKPVDSIVETGAGTLNIDAARISTNGEVVSQTGAGGLLSHVRDDKPYPNTREGEESADRNYDGIGGTKFKMKPGRRSPDEVSRYDRNNEVMASAGRWPANFLLTHSAECARVGTKKVTGSNFEGHESGRINSVYGEDHRSRPAGGYADNGIETVEDWKCVEGCPVLALDRQSGELTSGGGNKSRNGDTAESACYGTYGSPAPDVRDVDMGTASRFFHQSDWELEKADPFCYAAKAATAEREEGLFGIQPCHKCRGLRSRTHEDGGRTIECRRNNHPTIKPLALTKYLASLLLPPIDYAPRRLLVPFAGAASEMSGAALAGWEEIVGVESDPTSVAIAEKRFTYWRSQYQGKLF